jgi:hypothetical protein
MVPRSTGTALLVTSKTCSSCPEMVLSGLTMRPTVATARPFENALPAGGPSTSSMLSAVSCAPPAAKSATRLVCEVCPPTRPRPSERSESAVRRWYSGVPSPVVMGGSGTS